VKRFAAAAAFAAGLHLLLFSLDTGRRSSRDLLHPSTETVTIVLNAAAPRMAEPRRLSAPPDSALQPPPEKQTDSVSVSENPVALATPPKPVKRVERNVTRIREAVKPAAPAALPPEPKAAEFPSQEPRGMAEPGSPTEGGLPDEGRPLPSQAADGRLPIAAEPSAASQQPAAPPVLREATPEYDQNPAPEYPRRARQLGFEGTVVLNVMINQKGGVEDVKIAVSSGYSLLDQSALRSVKAWRFKPARRGDQPVAAWVQVPVRYTLESPGSRMP
jgi:periplasmic protein TonB